MIRTLFGLGLVMVAACSSGSGRENHKPAGTPTDPVDVCERVGDVCRIDDSRLGVCVTKPSSACNEAPCYACQPQH